MTILRYSSIFVKIWLWEQIVCLIILDFFDLNMIISTIQVKFLSVMTCQVCHATLRICFYPLIIYRGYLISWVDVIELHSEKFYHNSNSVKHNHLYLQLFFRDMRTFYPHIIHKKIYCKIKRLARP